MKISNSINGSNTSTQGKINLLDRTLELIQEGDRQISLEEGGCILVCGDTGSGKSTLINYLIGEDLIAIKPSNSKKLYIDTVSTIPKAKIGHQANSETFIPQKIKDEQSGQTYWDCPGFDDSRGPEIDIANAFYIKKLFSSNSLKAVIVVDEPSINGAKRGKVFKDLVSRLSELFVDKEDLVKCVSIVFTKVRDIEDYKAELTALISEIKGSLTSKELDILTAIVERAPMVSFELPFTEGPIDASQKEKILETISKSNFIPTPEVNITVATDSLVVLQELISAANKKIGGLIKTVSNELTAHTDQLGLEALQQVKTVLQKLVTRDSGATGCLEEIEAIVELISSNEAYGEERVAIVQKVQEVKMLMSYFDNFFTKIIPGASVDDSKLKGPFLVKLCHEIEFSIAKIIHKDNEEKLNKAIAEIGESQKAYQEHLSKKDHEFDLLMQAKEQQMALIVKQLEQEQQNRANFDNIMSQQHSTICSLQEEIQKLKMLPDNSSALESLSQQMIALTNHVIELELHNAEPEIHYHTTNYTDDGGCVLF